MKLPAPSAAAAVEYEVASGSASRRQDLPLPLEGSARRRAGSVSGLGGLVLAAGDGSRFGSAKQLAELHGRPLLEHAVGAMLRAAAIDRVVVVLGARADEICASTRLPGAEICIARDWAEGMSASLRTGVAALARSRAIVITLGDQPLITSEAITTVAERAAASEAVSARATYGGEPGHPVVIKQQLFSRVGSLRGDAGARGLLENVGVMAVECGAVASAVDVDTPADLSAIVSMASTE